MRISQLYERAANFDRAKRFANDPDADLDIHTHFTKRALEERREWQAKLKAFALEQRAYGKGDVAIPLMPGFSVGYQDGATYIADFVAPIVKGDISRRFTKWSRRDASRIVNTSVSSKGDPKETSIDAFNDTYSEVGQAEIAKISNADIADAVDIPDLFEAHQQAVHYDLMRSRESRVSTLLMASGSYAAGCYLAVAGTNKWDVGAATSTADPLDDIRVKAKAAASVAGGLNAGVCSFAVAEVLRKHPKVVAAAGTTASARVVSDDELRQVLGLKYLFVSDVKYDTAGNDPTANYSYLWGKGFAVIHVNPAAQRNDMSFAKTFRHHDLEYIDMIDLRPGVRGITILKGSHSDAEKVVASDRGFLLGGVIS